MGEPPRLSEIQLPWEISIIYFVTLCVEDRRKVLANPKVFEAIKTTVSQLRRWRVLAGVIMPDHVHWIVAHIDDRELSVGDMQQASSEHCEKR
jgi:REP element-mobilizing transposase RayT